LIASGLSASDSLTALTSPAMGHEHQVAQLLLCVVGDADGHAAVVFATQPLVVLGVTELGRYVAHLTALLAGQTKGRIMPRGPASVT
jgi:hypothetical protein